MGKFRLFVKPGAKRDAVQMMDDGTIKVYIKARAIEGKANKYLIKYISKITNISKSKIHIISGEKGRYKIIEVEGVEKFPLPNNG